MLATASLELKGKKESAHDCPVLSVAFSPKGNTIVSASGDRYGTGGTNTIKVWDAGTLARARLLTQPKAKHPHACYSFPGAQGGDAEGAQPLRDLRGLFP
jgi:WD40 repeat protein